MGRAFSTSYLAGEAAARAFLPRDFRHPAERAAAVRRAASRRLDPALVAVLRAQQSALPASPARDRNLEALAAGQTAVVVSGQQIGLFLGPLYTFYKAVTAIAVARALEAESGLRCVPLFWLQTEDHDFPEIASCTNAGAHGAPARLSLEAATDDSERMSVAHRRLGPEVDRLLDALGNLLGAAPAAGEVLALLGRHYGAGRPVAEAFTGALAEIFTDEGLLFFDPRDARVAALAAPIYRRAVTEAEEIDRALSGQAARLEAAGFAAQVGVRVGSPLVFFHPDGTRGPRYRLQSDGADRDWRLAGAATTVARAALLETLAGEPLRFSTSALLRPIVQDALLPTAAYVGGPAEISYFAELEPLYARFGVSAPLIVPRARFRCIDGRARRWLAALRLEPDDLARPLPELLARVRVAPASGATAEPDARSDARSGAASEAAHPDELHRRAATEIEPVVAQIAAAVVAAEPSLARAAERTRASVTRALARLTDRYARTRAARDAVVLQRLERLRSALYPGGVAQERVFGWPSLAAQLGPATFKRMVFDALAAAGPFETTLRELRP